MQSDNMNLRYLCLSVLVALLYISARGLCRRSMHFEASLLHFAMHVTGVMANAIIYWYADDDFEDDCC